MISFRSVPSGRNEEGICRSPVAVVAMPAFVVGFDVATVGMVDCWNAVKVITPPKLFAVKSAVRSVPCPKLPLPIFNVETANLKLSNFTSHYTTRSSSTLQPDLSGLSLDLVKLRKQLHVSSGPSPSVAMAGVRPNPLQIRSRARTNIALL